MNSQISCLAKDDAPQLRSEAVCACDIQAVVEISGRRVTVRGHICGPENAPVVVALGGISAHRHVADCGADKGWWAAQAGQAKALDTDRFRILCFDYLGDEIAPFPTSYDQARAILALLDRLDAASARIVGASYGGMVALALAELAPERVDAALIISATDGAPAMARAWRSIQREAVTLGLRLGDGAAGLDLARRLAMTTYRTPEEFEARFGADGAESVESYLAARGAAYAESVSPQRFLALSKSLDAHQVDVSALRCSVSYLAVREDRLAPPDHIRAAAERTPRGGYHEISSLYGHDAFLKEAAAISRSIKNFISEET